MKRKGITPVIAVVLLLLITVAAVGLVWGLFQQVTGDQGALNELSNQQQARNTNVNYLNVYNSSSQGNITLVIENSGSEPVPDVSESLRLQASPPNSSDFIRVEEDGFSISGYEYYFKNQNSCFSGEGQTLEESSGNTYECSTGLRFPDPGQTMELRIQFVGVDSANWEYDCTPQTSGATFC